MRRDVWVFLFLLGIALFGWPFLAVARRYPAYYVFPAWALYICLIALLLRATERDEGGDGPQARRQD